MAEAAAAAAASAPSTSYRVLPVRLVGGGGAPALTRYLYIKPHASAADSLPKERTLFVAGVPVALQGAALVQLFGQFGAIERAALHGSRLSAVVLYAAAESRDKLMRAAAKGRALEVQVPEPAAPHGLKGASPWSGSCGHGSRMDGRCVAGCGLQQLVQRLQVCLLCGSSSHALPRTPANLTGRLGGGPQAAEARQCGAAGSAGRVDGGVGGGGGGAARGRAGRAAGRGLDGGAAAQGARGGGRGRGLAAGPACVLAVQLGSQPDRPSTPRRRPRGRAARRTRARAA